MRGGLSDAISEGIPFRIASSLSLIGEAYKIRVGNRMTNGKRRLRVFIYKVFFINPKEGIKWLLCTIQSILAP